jgi:hypothetical protein
MGRAYSTNGDKRNVYRILVGNAEGKRPLGGPRHWWGDNIEIDLIQAWVVWTGLI